MMGMVYKDFLVLRKQIRYYMVFFLVYGVLTITGSFGYYILPAVVVVLSMLMPMSSVAYDDQARWDKYAVSTPVGRRGVVAGKYLFTLITIAASSVFALLLMLVIRLLGLAEIPATEAIFTSLACAGVALLLNSFTLPVLIRFGAEKSRLISMIFFFLIFGGSMAVGTLLKNAGPFPAPPAWLLAALPAVLGLVSVGGFLVSYFIAQGIYAGKEL